MQAPNVGVGGEDHADARRHRRTAERCEHPEHSGLLTGDLRWVAFRTAGSGYGEPMQVCKLCRLQHRNRWRYVR